MLAYGFMISLACLLLYSCNPNTATQYVWLDELELAHIDQAAGGAVRNKSMWNTPLIIAKDTFERGVGSHASGTIDLILSGSAERFTAKVGIDASAPPHELEKATVEFLVIGDGEVLWKSGVMKAKDKARKIDLDLDGVQSLNLYMSHAGDGIVGDRANWVDARFELVEKPSVQPSIIASREKQPYILTPKAPDQPLLNHPPIYGSRPGNPFAFKIPSTGQEPKFFSVQGLPKGLKLNAATGMITGKTDNAGTYPLRITLRNDHGETSGEMELVIGDQLSLTPPMGWNSWNVFGDDIDQEKIMRMADAMVSSGLINYGYTYINIDDGWQGERGGKYNAIMPNEKFPDMKGLVDHIHSLGLKAGIYSSPWITSYAGFVGGSADQADGTILEEGKRHGDYSFHEEDVRQWVEWGFDYLKYDWNPIDVEHCELMTVALENSGRDIVYTLSNAASMDQADKWARLSNAWRTTFDIKDSWHSMTSIGFTQNGWAPYAGNGHWNDPDMLVVGHVGWGDPHPSKLTPDEQYIHISQWSLLAAPLLSGCDLSKLDDFTLNLLTNREVIAVNQDRLGRQATRVRSEQDGLIEIWARPLYDGSYAVGLFNLTESPRVIDLNWSDLDLEGEYIVCDLWRQHDLGAHRDRFGHEVPRHGVFLVKITPNSNNQTLNTD